MSATLAPGASLRRMAEIVRHAVLLGPDAWTGGSSSGEKENPNARPNLLPTDRDMVELFTLLGERGFAYLLVGGIAMLRYVEGRNTEVVDLLMSLPSVKQLPEIVIDEQSEDFVRGRFRSVRVDVLLTANAVFAEVQQNFGTRHRCAELDAPTATPAGLILLKTLRAASTLPPGPVRPPLPLRSRHRQFHSTLPTRGGAFAPTPPTALGSGCPPRSLIRSAITLAAPSIPKRLKPNQRFYLGYHVGATGGSASGTQRRKSYPSKPRFFIAVSSNLVNGV